MQQHNLPQGSPEWLAHRRQHFNASDAPAMLGCSPYKTRSELLRELATGVAAEVDAGTQRRYDNGHRFEGLARPIGEGIVGEELYPVVGSDGKLSASYDGITMGEDVVWEHKTCNADLRAALPHEGSIGATLNQAARLPRHYLVQMEQQLLVSGAAKVLFSATRASDDGEVIEERHCWYYGDNALRAEIVAGWKQFAEDLAAYSAPAATAPKVVAEPVEALPAPMVQVSGQLTLTDNFKVFEQRLRQFLDERLIREPQTDEDFVNLDAQIKAMKGAEAALKAAEAQMLAQIQSVDQAKKTKDMLLKLVSDNRKLAENLLASEKERRRGEIVAAGVKAMADHVASLNVRLGKPFMPPVPADFGGAIKGLKSLASMENAIGTELARAKIAANEIADRIQVNLQALDELAADVPFLFADTAQLVLKAADDCRATITSRIAEHKAAEERRLEAERERIRAEEQAKLAREQAAREAEERRQQLAMEAAAAHVAALPPAPAPTPAPAANVVPMPPREVVTITAPSLRLGQINERLSPLSIDAAGLAYLGFPPVGKEGAAKLYNEHDFPRICAALIARLQVAQQKRAA
jgi:putative phage-type endonuclease